jgi:hypothetical protein
LAYYTNLLDTGESNLQQITVNVMYGSTGDDATKINNKLSAANSLTNMLTNNSLEYPTAYASTFLSSITEDAATVTNAKAGLVSQFGVPEASLEEEDSTITDTIVSSSVLKKTGVITSYVDYDDGYYKAGLNHSYTTTNDSDEYINGVYTSIVKDNVTGLYWQNFSSNVHINKTQAEATSFCNDMERGGYTDWRLPTAREILTISDYGNGQGLNSSLTSTQGYLWTQTTPNNSSEKYIGGEFFGSAGLTSLEKDFTAEIKCVRGVRIDKISSLSTNSDGTVADSVNNLMWQNIATPNIASWSEQIVHCASLDYAGHSDWRLPNINELYSVFDFSTMTFNTAFTNAIDGHYASATGTSMKFVSLYFSSGNTGLSFVHRFAKDDSRYAICVRSSN